MENIRRFFAPPVFDDEEKTHEASLLNFISLLFLILAVLGILATYFTRTVGVGAWFVNAMGRMLPVLVPALLSQVLLRRGLVRVGSFIFTLSLWLAFIYLTYIGGGAGASGYANFMFIILLSGLLLGIRSAFTLTILSIASGSVMLYMASQGALPEANLSATKNWLISSVFFLNVIGLLYLFLQNQNKARQAAELANIELQKAGEELERRVVDATQNLTLAAEVGRSVSQALDLDTLLKDAVELIQDRFDMYYTQAYLLDAAGRRLIMRAGTGSVGQKLLARRHSLPMDLASLNGTAAAERRAVIVEDTEKSNIHRPNPLLPETRSEMVVPLLIGDRVVGVLDLQSSVAGALNEENLAAFETLAGQIAVAVQNIELLNETESARAEIEKQAQRLIHSGWRDYLNAVERGEKIGYTYDLEEITPFNEEIAPTLDGENLVATIQVSNEPVGTMQFEGQENWTSEDTELVNNIAQQLGQQVENLRLLAQADQYRTEAENALRRLTREGWDEYQEQTGDAELGFLYKDSEVKTLVENNAGFENELTYEIKVRNEIIGQFGIEGFDALSGEDAELAESITEHLSAHVESLRLSEQTQTALSQTEVLYQIGSHLNSATNADEVLTSVMEETKNTGYFEASLFYMEDYESDDPTVMTKVASWHHKNKPALPVGYQLDLQVFTALNFLMSPNKVRLIPDIPNSKNLGPEAKAIWAKTGSTAIVIIPISQLGRWLGILTFSWNTPHEFSQIETAIYEAMINLVTPIIQTHRLFEQTQAALDEVQRSEETLRKISELQTAIFEGAEYAILATTTEGILTAFNAGAEKMLGYSAEEVIDKKDAGIFHDLDEVVERAGVFSKELGYEIEPGFEVFIARSRQNLPNEYEWTYIRKDGARLPVSLAISSLRDGDGNITGFLGIAKDITEQKKADEAIRLSEARLSSIVDNAPEAIMVVDVETGLFTDPNKNAEDFFGLKHDELIKVGPIEMSPPEQPDGRPSDEKAMAQINAALEGKTPVFEWVHRNASGEDIDCEIRLVRMPDPTRQLIRISIIDISERKEAEQILRESQERAQTILESVTLPMIITRNSDNRITFANQLAADSVGISMDKVTNSPELDLFAVSEERIKFVAELSAKGIVNNMQILLKRHDQSTFWALISARFFVYQGEESSLVTIADISDRIAAQEAVTKRAAELATVAEVSTAAARALNTDDLLQEVVDLTRKRFNLYHAHIYLLDEEKENLQVQACGWEEGSPHSGTHGDAAISLATKKSLVIQATRNRQAVVVNDTHRDPNWLPNEMMPDTRSEMAIPLIVGDDILGVYDIQSNEVNHFTDEDISIQTTLAAQVAVALQNARSFEQAKEQAEQESTINIISQRIQGTTSVEDALQVAVRELGRALGAKQASIQLDISSEE